MDGTPHVSDESTRVLWERFIRAREPQLRARLIERYLPLARNAAARFYRLRSDDSVPFEDYLQYARTGLVEAIDDYDPGREASFETYSGYRIRGAMLNGLGRESEIAAQRNFWRTRSQDPLEPQGGGPAIGFLLDEGDDVADEAVQANPHVAVEQVELLTRVGSVLEKLPARERELIRRHYFEQCELRVIAHELCLTPGRISQLHAQALLRIRQLLYAPSEQGSA
jgi:RNA polymerase sigma factor for flagellar operon FliA